MAVVNEHPDANVRKLYAGEVAAQTGLADRRPGGGSHKRRERAPGDPGQCAGAGPAPENAEFVAIALLVQHWDDIAAWLIEELFADEVYRRAFLALAAADGDLDAALEPPIPRRARCSSGRRSPTSRPIPEVEVRNLIAAAVRRELAPAESKGDPDRIRDDREARLQVEELTHAEGGAAASEWLLGWLHRRMAPRSDGGSGSA